VDRYRETHLAAIGLILLLSILDGLLTLQLLGRGAKEINPVMAYLLEIDPKLFMVLKYLLTSASLVVLLILRNVFIQKIKLHSNTIFGVFSCIFIMVIAWELFLLYWIR